MAETEIERKIGIMGEYLVAVAIAPIGDTLQEVVAVMIKAPATVGEAMIHCR